VRSGSFERQKRQQRALFVGAKRGERRAVKGDVQGAKKRKD
jgi:hypothetical protein